MTTPIEPAQTSGAVDSLSSSSPVSQELMNELLLFSLAYGSDDPSELMQEIEKMKQEITSLLPKLPKQQADEISKILNELPGMGSKDSAAEIKGAFTNIAALIAEAIPNGLSIKDKNEIEAMLKQQPSSSDKNYAAEICDWSVSILGTIASDLPGLLSDKAKNELQALMNRRPSPSSKDYLINMMKFSASVQELLVENLPSSVSEADKEKVKMIVAEMQNVDPEDKNAPSELEALSAQLQKEMESLFF